MFRRKSHRVLSFLTIIILGFSHPASFRGLEIFEVTVKLKTVV